MAGATETASIWRAYWRVFGGRFLQVCLVIFVDGAAATAAPYFLSGLLTELSQDGGGSDATIYGNAAGLAISRLASKRR